MAIRRQEQPDNTTFATTLKRAIERQAGRGRTLLAIAALAALGAAASHQAAAREVPAPMGADGVAEALRADGEAAAGLVPLIFDARPGCPRQDAYETAWAIARWGRNADVEPELLARVIAKESAFDPSCRGASGEIGLGQLMPVIRRSYGLTDAQARTISPNVQATALHLGCLMREAGGDRKVALARFNGGPRGEHVARCRSYARGLAGGGF